MDELLLEKKNNLGIQVTSLIYSYSRKFTYDLVISKFNHDKYLD
jgi:hypothetical protein